MYSIANTVPSVAPGLARNSQEWAEDPTTIWEQINRSPADVHANLDPLWIMQHPPHQQDDSADNPVLLEFIEIVQHALFSCRPCGEYVRSRIDNDPCRNVIECKASCGLKVSIRLWREPGTWVGQGENVTNGRDWRDGILCAGVDVDEAYEPNHAPDCQAPQCGIGYTTEGVRAPVSYFANVSLEDWRRVVEQQGHTLALGDFTDEERLPVEPGTTYKVCLRLHVARLNIEDPQGASFVPIGPAILDFWSGNKAALIQHNGRTRVFPALFLAMSQMRVEDKAVFIATRDALFSLLGPSPNDWGAAHVTGELAPFQTAYLVVYIAGAVPEADEIDETLVAPASRAAVGGPAGEGAGACRWDGG